MSASANRGLLFGLVFIAALMCVPTASAQWVEAGGDWEYFVPFDYDVNMCPIWELSGDYYGVEVDDYCIMDFSLAQDENGNITGVGDGESEDGDFFVYISGTIKGTNQSVNTGDYDGTVKVNLKFVLEGAEVPFSNTLTAKMELDAEAAVVAFSNTLTAKLDADGFPALLSGTIRTTAHHNATVVRPVEFSFYLGEAADGSWDLWVDPIVTSANGSLTTLHGFAAANVSSEWYGSIYEDPEEGHWLVFNLNGTRNVRKDVAVMTLKGLTSFSQNIAALDYFWIATYARGFPVSFNAQGKTKITLSSVYHDYLDDELYIYFPYYYGDDYEYYWDYTVFGDITVNMLGQQAYTPSKGNCYFEGALNVAGPGTPEDEGEFGFWWWWND